MITAPSPQVLPFHRLARSTDRYRWWRPVLGTAVLIVLWVIAIGFEEIVSYAVGAVLGREETPDGTMDFGTLPNTVSDLLGIAVILPLVLLVVRWIGRRRAGTVVSVAGRMRWGWLGWCLLVAVPCMVLLVLAEQVFVPVTPDAPTEALVEWPVFAAALIVLILTVPLQAAAEEYAFRGWFLQAVGGFARPAWLAVLPQAVLFGAAHGWGTVWGFVALCFFGVVAGWLTIRTGGLEAAIAVHVVNNLVAFGLAALVVGGLDDDGTAADATWQFAVLDMVVTALFAVAIVWLLRRRERRAATVSAPAERSLVADMS